MDVLVLSGGRGQRLEPARKKIQSNFLPTLNSYEDQEGPKGLAMLHMAGQSRPLLDWHLSIYMSTASIRRIFLGLGFAAEMICSYYQAAGGSFAGIPIEFLMENRPAGTIAPLVKLKQKYGLPQSPLILANGDNLLNLNFDEVYHALNKDPLIQKRGMDHLVFDIITPMPHEESGCYGVIELDDTQHFARCFHEKQACHKNPYVIVDGVKKSYINTGFSLIPNPQAVLSSYITPEIEDMICCLENGEADYKENESFVKYETMYEKIAARGCLAVVKYHSFWADSGSEAQIVAIEQATDAGHGLKSTPPKN